MEQKPDVQVVETDANQEVSLKRTPGRVVELLVGFKARWQSRPVDIGARLKRAGVTSVSWSAVSQGLDLPCSFGEVLSSVVEQKLNNLLFQRGANG